MEKAIQDASFTFCGLPVLALANVGCSSTRNAFFCARL
ncbi:hypothetical protein CFT9_22635 [Pseudomonas sp. CFT9]|nr:hypothetical protein CFT9_22635 [Pseudomonas sp. CFT9]